MLAARDLAKLLMTITDLANENKRLREQLKTFEAKEIAIKISCHETDK